MQKGLESKGASNTPPDSRPTLLVPIFIGNLPKDFLIGSFSNSVDY